MRRRFLAAAIVAVAIVAADASRPPDRQWSARAVLAGIHVYQATLSRVFAAGGVVCRFTPTCSHYAEACIRRFGVVRGGGLALARLMRCGPWTAAGTVDPPPLET
ncbi:MAG: membrane protein insertion efficiency factor YidD [Vicinamibacterales bacterium]